MKAPATSRQKIAFLALLCLLLQASRLELVTAQSGGNLHLRRNVIAGGGNTSSGGGNLQISGTAGQAAAGTQTAGGHITQVGGFWPAIMGMSLTSPLPGAGVLQFSNASYNTLEDCAGTVITITRSNGSTGTVTVDYATSDGSAQQRADYETRLGKVIFAEGVTSRTFTVLTNRDAYVEGQETINLTLSNPTGGAVLGDQSTAALILTDNVSVPSNSQPIDEPANFVCQHYHDFLNRQPDASGLAFWTTE